MILLINAKIVRQVIAMLVGMIIVLHLLYQIVGYQIVAPQQPVEEKHGIAAIQVVPIIGNLALAHNLVPPLLPQQLQLQQQLQVQQQPHFQHVLTAVRIR
jgi:sorbitol-specific phosphotransferase system component IIC